MGQPRARKVARPPDAQLGDEDGELVQRSEPDVTHISYKFSYVL
jgi:hypothetical protein